MLPRIPENVSSRSSTRWSVDLSLVTIMRATRIPPQDPNDDGDEEEDDAEPDDDLDPAVVREPDE